jgi:hypothetical protein
MDSLGPQKVPACPIWTRLVPPVPLGGLSTVAPYYRNQERERFKRAYFVMKLRRNCCIFAQAISPLIRTYTTNTAP